ncbi:MAG: SDR family NAD(P)-dependent oxidoreductase [Pseudomonadota bacterium]
MTKWLTSGNTAVITGAAGGIGLETARRCASAGMNTVLVDVKQDELKAAEQSLSSTSGKVHAVICDVSDNSQVEQMRDEVLARFEKVHCLMSNAGIGRMGTKPWDDLDAFNQMLGN